MDVDVLERLPRWLRWICVLPASFIAYFLIQVLNALAPVPDFVASWFNAFAGPLAFVVAGAVVAPAARSTTSLVLAIVAGSLLLVIALLDSWRGAAAWSLWGQVLLGVGGAGVGSVIGKVLKSSRAEGLP